MPYTSVKTSAATALELCPEGTSKGSALPARRSTVTRSPLGQFASIWVLSFAKITSGSATMIQNNILTDEEVKEGLVLTCQAIPETKEITIDFDDV